MKIPLNLSPYVSLSLKVKPKIVAKQVSSSLSDPSPSTAHAKQGVLAPLLGNVVQSCSKMSKMG